MTAFWDLNTCRPPGFNGPGAIPWTAVIDYADRAGLDGDMAPAFVRIMRAMDKAYLDFASEEAEKTHKRRQSDGDRTEGRRSDRR